jgi:hypothetical protein
MEKNANEYMKRTAKSDSPQHTDFHVAYYADNAVIGVFSLRDKLALALWSYFVDFNPYEDIRLADLGGVVKGLTELSRAGGKSGRKARELLLPLLGLPKSLRAYRHMKIHRREPRIEIYGVAAHHDWPYLVAVVDEADHDRFREELRRVYPDPKLRRAVERGCIVRGVTYRTLDLRENKRLMTYRSLHNALLSYRRICYAVAADAILFLRRRAPFRRS